MTPPELSVVEIRRYLDTVELPARTKELPHWPIEEIVRFGSFVGSSVEWHEDLNRTMDKARSTIDLVEKNNRAVESGGIIIAERLSGSKGRFTRTWHAPEGGLWGCLIHANTLMPQAAMLLSLAVGVAACEAVRQAGVKNAAIRWVNDILADGLKLAGFLIESHCGPVSREQFHLVGFGINVNNTVFPHEIRDTASSIRQQLHHSIDLKEFAVSFIAKLTFNLGLLYFTEAQQDDVREELREFDHPVIERWKKFSDTIGKKVWYGNDVIQNPLYTARVKGVGCQGGLHMSLEDGSEITEHCGEVRYL